MNSVEHLSRARDQKALCGNRSVVGSYTDALRCGPYPRSGTRRGDNCGFGSPSGPAPVGTRLLQLGKSGQGTRIREPVPRQPDELLFQLALQIRPTRASIGIKMLHLHKPDVVLFLEQSRLEN